MKGTIVVNIPKCVGCHSCELACAVEHSLSKNLYQAVSESPRPQKRVEVECYGRTNLPLQCRHCADAPCVRVCPTSALYKQDQGEVVLVDQPKCIGCKWCVLACPFGVITLGFDDKAVIKCDLCLERAGRNEEPACVEGCPTGALELATVEEAARSKRREFLVEFLREE